MLAAKGLKMGKQNAILLSVQLIDIHGSKFYDLQFQIGEKTPQISRIGVESVYPNPQVGDEVRVSLILGQLTGVEKIPQ
jgi:hypothetical protein